MPGATLPLSGERSVAALTGGAKPIAGKGGLEGFTPPHRFKARTAASDGQRAFTRAARSAGLRFAVIVLSETIDVGRDHLIHRKRSPFPYEGKDLTPLKLRRDCNFRARHFQHAASKTLPHCRTAKGCSHSRAPAGRSPSPAGVGWRGSPLRTDSRRGHESPTDSVPTPAPRAAQGSGLR